MSGIAISHLKGRGKHEWESVFLKLLITAKLPVLFSPDTSNFHGELISLAPSPSINLTESNNLNVLTETT